MAKKIIIIYTLLAFFQTSINGIAEEGTQDGNVQVITFTEVFASLPAIV